MKTRIVGRNIIYRKSVSSTMDVAREEAKRGAAEGTVVVAEKQKAGRGRHGRKWISPKGNIYLSIILYPRVNWLPRLVMITSLAIVHTIEHLSKLRPTIKWPNDVLIGGKKVAGVLIENDFKDNKVNFTIVGMGLNIHLIPENFPEISETATSLSTQSELGASKEKFLASLLTEFDTLYRALGEGKPVGQEWLARLETVGRRVRVKTGDVIEEGYAESVDDDGHLLLRHNDGSLVSLATGEIAPPI